MKAFLRWAGSKKQLLPILETYWDGNGTYYEPFAGSSCLFFHIEPRRGVLGDINRELIQTLRGVRDNPKSIVSILKRFSPVRAEYNKLREFSPAELGKSERAARFIFLNHHSFNGLYRTNAAGRFNVPFGRHKVKRAINFEVLGQASTLLKRARLLNDDFEATVQSAKRGDFVYMDPPYFSSTRRIFGEYGPRTFGSADMLRLSRCLVKLHNRGVKFVVSYLYSTESRAIFSRWSVRRIRIRRNIAGFCSARRGAYELLACNFGPDGTLLS